MVAASRVAGFLAMYYKEKFNRPRPSSLSPGLFPPVTRRGMPPIPAATRRRRC